MSIPWSGSPGLSMRYSNPEDAGRLEEKLIGLVELGATRVALLLDDIPDRLQHPGDRAAFPDLATAQAETANRRRATAWRQQGTPLVSAPPSTGETATRSTSPGSPATSTHASTCSGPVGPSARRHRPPPTPPVSRRPGRPPLYWDNYPVNDVAMGNELHIGPYRGRDRDLDRFSRGILANAMELSEASKIPFATIADYLWDPEGYDPEASWRAAIERGGRGGRRTAFARSPTTSGASCLDDHEPDVTAALEPRSPSIRVPATRPRRLVRCRLADCWGRGRPPAAGRSPTGGSSTRSCALDRGVRAGADAVSVIAALAARWRRLGARPSPIGRCAFRDVLEVARRPRIRGMT